MEKVRKVKLVINLCLIPSTAKSLCDIEKTTEYFFLSVSHMENGDLITWQTHKCQVRTWALVWTALSAPYHGGKEHLLPGVLDARLY